MLKEIITLTIYILLSFLIVAQVRESKHLGMEHGLSNNSIADITQDGQGLMWIATESGLNRFDGKDFTVYTKSNSGLVSNELNALLYDKDENRLWIGSQRDGISVFDCNTHSFTNYYLGNGLVTNDITDLTHATDGGIWVTHYHVGIEYYDKKTKKFSLFADRDIPGMGSLNWCARDDGNGFLYVGHTYDGLSIIDLEKRTARNFRNRPEDPKSLPGNNVHSIYIDHQKNIWIATDAGLALFNPNTEEFTTFKHDPNNPVSIGSDAIYGITEMRDSTLWISRYLAGISIINLNDITFSDPTKITFKNMPTGQKNGLSSSDIRTIFQDSYDNIWIGNYRQGIDFISNISPIFKTISYPSKKADKVNDKQIWGICIDDDQRLWVGSEFEITVFDNGIVKRSIDIRPYVTSRASSIYVNKIKKDSDGNLWVGTNKGGVLKINPQTYSIQSIELSKRGEYVTDFWEDKDGAMLIATENGLYSCINHTVVFEQQINEQVGDKTIYSVLRDRQGKLWVGTFGKGIFVFDPANKLVDVINRDSHAFPSNAINYLFQDSNGSIWAATRNGLAYFGDTNKPRNFKICDEKHNLENPHVRAIQEDNSGNIWISTNAGVSRWNRQENKFYNYNLQDGVPIGDFTNGSVSIKNEGTLFFGKLNAVCYFNPSELTDERKQNSRVQITDCIVLSHHIDNGSRESIVYAKDTTIVLSYNQNSFRISFSVPDYAINSQIEYAYKMEGLDNSWHSTNGENQITFRNISHGKYTFYVKSRVKNQEWDDTSVSALQIIVRPPLWLTWYAKILYGLIICAIGYIVISSYRRRVNLRSSLEMEKKASQHRQELNNERLRFYTNITHELRTPLTLILGPLEDMLRDKELPFAYNKKINTIYGSANRLLSLINQLLEFRKAETQNKALTVSKGNLTRLISEIVWRFKDLNQNDKVNVTFEVEEKDLILYFDADLVTMILDNLLSNALKYTPKGEIKVVLRSLEDDGIPYIEILVSDTGYGIENDAIEHIFDPYYQVNGPYQASGTGIGLALVKSLVKLHEGILKADSTVDRGTTFSFRLVADNIYPNALHDESNKKIDTFEDITGGELVYEDANPVILVVEDNNDIREYIIGALETDYHTLTGADGKEGLNLAQKHIPDIIISDIMMPEMDGITLCRKIKDDIRTSHIPVILLTAKDTVHDKEAGYESGADSYLTKPFSTRLLSARIDNLLRSRKKLAEQIAAHTRTKAAGQQHVEETEDVIKIGKLDQEFLEKLTEIIDDNLDIEGLDIAFLKEKMNMSYSTFYRKVRGLTNLSPNEFIRKVRLKNSAQFILTGQYSISQVAYMVGFNDVVYFRQCFKKEFGITPSEYKKLNTE